MKFANKISLVVALNSDYVIGTENKLPWHIPEDLAYFKQVTLGKPIIMGRKTFESIGRALPGRKNIVISNSFSHPDVTTYTSLVSALNDNQDVNEICVIGGGQIFQQALEYADILHLTWVDVPVASPCAWFPQVDFSQWQLDESRELLSQSGIKCLIEKYSR